MKESVQSTDTIRGLPELEQYCKKLLAQLQSHDRILILLRGELGAGKTKTVETLLRHLGIEGVASPTFAIHHHYHIKDLNIEHFDLYRIESDSDLESTGFWDVFMQTQAWVIIEWPERLGKNELPKNWPIVEIDISFLGQVSDEKSEVRIIKTTFN